MWSSPMERAAQLKRQQKVLREQEWNAKPEYEKRRVVVSVDLVGGKVVRRMGEVERPEDHDDEIDFETEDASIKDVRAGNNGTGAFGRNPLLGGLIRPVWRNLEDGDSGGGMGKGKGKAVRNTLEEEEEEESNKENRQRNTWRRVQDDNDDNEAMILDGGVYGGREDQRMLGAEERVVG